MGSKIFKVSSQSPQNKKVKQYKKEDQGKIPKECQDPLEELSEKYIQEMKQKIQELSNFVQDFEENELNVSDSEILKNQIIMMLFGMTGVGKSTLMNYYRKKELEFKNKQIIVKDDDNEFQIGDQCKAQTRKVSGIKLKKFYVCDSPGLIDTEGHLKDIVNTKNILNAINNSQKFNMAFVISTKDFDGRVLNLRQSIKSFSKYFQKMNKSLCLIINRVKSDKKNEQMNKIRKCLNQLKQEQQFSQPEINLINKIDQMIQKQDYLIFYPLKREEINKHIDFIEKKNFSKTQIKIRDVISEESLNKCSMMIKDCADYFKYLIKKRKKDAGNIFSDLQKVQRFIGEELVGDIINQLTQFIKKQIENDMNDIKFIVENISDAENLEEFIIKLINNLESQQNLCKILENQNQKETYQDRIEKSTQLIIDQIQKLVNQIKSSDDCSQIIQIYSKIEQISENEELNKFLNQYQKKEDYLLNVQQIIQGKQRKIFDFIQDIIKNTQIKRENLQDLKNALEFIQCFQRQSRYFKRLKDFPKFDHILLKFQELTQKFLKTISEDYDFKENSHGYKKLLGIIESKQIMSYEFIMNFNNCIEELQDSNNQTTINENIQKIKKQIQKLQLGFLSNISQNLWLQNQNQITIQIKSLIQLAELDINVIEEISKNQTYQTCQANVEKLLQFQKSAFKEINIKIFNQSEITINDDQKKIFDKEMLNELSVFSQSLSFLIKLLQWVDLFKNNFQDQNRKIGLNDINLFNSKISEEYSQNSKSKRNFNSFESKIFSDFNQEEFEEKSNETKQDDSQSNECCEVQKFREKYQQLLYEISQDTNHLSIFNQKKFKKIQFVFEIIYQNEKNQIDIFASMESKFFKFLSNKLLTQKQFNDIKMQNYQQIMQQSSKIQNLFQYKEFLQNFQSHLLVKFRQYESSINSDERQQQLQIKKYDFGYLKQLDPLINKIQQIETDLKNQIEQIIKHEVFNSQEINQIQNIEPKDLKVSFDKLREIFNLEEIKILFGQDSLYTQYQKSFINQLNNLTEQMDEKQKKNEDVFQILETFKQFLEYLNEHIPQEWYLSIDILQNLSYQKTIFKLMLDRFQYEQLLKKKQEIQDEELKYYIDQIFSEQIEKFLTELSDMIQQCEDYDFTDKQLEKIVNQLNKCEQFFKIQKNSYNKQRSIIISEFKKINVIALKYVLEDINLNKEIQFMDLIQKVLKIEGFYDKKVFGQDFFQTQIQNILNEIENQIQFCAEDAILGYQVGKISKILNFLSLLNIDQNQFILVDNIQSIKDKLLKILDNQIILIIYSQLDFDQKQLQNVIEKTLKEEFEFLKPIDINEICKKNINEVQKQLDRLQQIFDQKDFDSLKQVIEKKYTKPFIMIEERILIFLIDIESDIFNIYLESNQFQKIKSTFQKINELTEIEFFTQSNSLISKVDSIGKRFDQKIQQYLNQQISFKDTKNLKNRIEKVNKLIQIDQINLQNSANLEIKSKLFEQMSKPIISFYQDIMQSIEQFESENIQKNFNLLKILNETKFEINNNKQNYFYIFSQLCNSTFKLQYNKSIEYSELFKKPPKQVIQNLAKETQQNLTQNTTLQHIKLKQYQQIVQQQLKYEAYCNRVIGLIDLDKKIIIAEVEKEYKKEMAETQKYFKEFYKNIQEIISKEDFFYQIEKLFLDKSTEIQNIQFAKIIKQQLDKFILQYKANLNIENLDNQENKQQFAQKLIELYRLSIEHKSEYLESQCSLILAQAIKGQNLKTVQDLIKFFKLDKLGCQLTENNNEVFYEWNVQMYNKSTENQNNFKYIEDNIKCIQSQDDPKFDCANLRQQFDKYFQFNTKTNNDILVEQQYDIIKLQNDIKEKAADFKKNNQYLNSDNIVWSTKQKLEIIELLSLISSAWTILNNEDQSKTMKYIHKVQIVAIMRILNIDLEQQSKLQNHVLEIKTGEGKSIIIGISAIVFALIGFNIDCCCYSQYLSERDQKDFQSFFKLFNVQDKICYNTFEKLTEKMFNTPYKLAEIGQLHILKNNSISLKQGNNQTGKRIIFIDEVDFFFDKDFLGKVYPVVLQVSNPEIIELFRFIWNRRYSKITLESVKISNQYHSLINKNLNLNHLVNLIDLKIVQMIEDAKNMEDHSYILSDVPDSQEKIIGYKHIDSYRYDIVKRYKTSFAYYVEYQLKKLQKQQLIKVLNLNFNLGCFSYSKILYGYSTIIGVSGTVQQLQKYQKDQMKKFQIEKQTILPSVFGQTLLEFNHQQGIHVIQIENQYYQQISLQINNEIQKKRAVIVFFENHFKLNAFKQQFKPQSNFEIQVLDEKNSDKQYIINKATLSQVLTLSTNSFGRGTDFKCFDDIVKQNKGIHIIQTFLSETEAGLIQIQGRTARNGEYGSYSLIILLKSLELSFGFKGSISNENKYEQLQKIIQLKQEQLGQQLEKDIRESEELHSKSLELKKLLEEQHESKKDLGNQINRILKEISDLSDSKDSFVNQPTQKQNLDYQLAEKDIFGDPVGENFDLAKNGSCQSKKILIGQFCDASDCDITSDLQNCYKKALELKGFQEFQIETDEQIFANKIQYYDQIQIFSGSKFRNQYGGLKLRQIFVEEVIKHLEKGKGLMLWSDNDPFYYHANIILNKLPIGYEDQSPIYINLQGNDLGGKNLSLGEFDQRLSFKEHPIVKGLFGIYEGSTICYPKIKGNLKEIDDYQDYCDLEIVGTGSQMRPCMFVLNATKYRGRVVFDCGFTKILHNLWDKTRGTQRYVQNCYCWLNYIEQIQKEFELEPS